jgi:hypothetical protein
MTQSPLSVYQSGDSVMKRQHGSTTEGKFTISIHRIAITRCPTSTLIIGT